MCTHFKCITHYPFFFFFFILGSSSILCIGCDFPHHSAVLTPNNKSNLHFSASSFVMESIAKIHQGESDVEGDSSQRRGAVANFMPCIFLSCMANSWFKPARWNKRPVIFPSPPSPGPVVVEPELSLRGESLQFHIAVCFHTALIQREPDKTSGETVVAVPFGFATLDWFWDVNDYPPPPSTVPSLVLLHL